MKKLSPLLLILIAQAAHAQHPSSPSYTGFYASIAGGGTIADFNVDQDFAVGASGNFAATLPTNVNMQGGSPTGLIGLGYSYQFNNHFVLGAEAIAEFNSIEVTHRNELFSESLGLVGGKFESKLRNDFALLFKAGYVFHRRTQLYAFVGPRWGNFESTLTTNFENITDSDEVSGYQLGITAGAGLEHLITDRLSLGIDYAYTDYGSINSPNTLTTDTSSPPTIATNDTNIKASTNTILGKLSYYF